MLERPVLHHEQILQFVDFQDGSCTSSCNFEIFDTQSLIDTFRIIVLNFVEIGRTDAISVFQVKCKN